MERDELQQRLTALRERLQEAARRADGSHKEAKAAARTGGLHPALIPTTIELCKPVTPAALLSR